MVNAHRLAEERSLALHCAVADKLASDPETLERARARVRSWLESAEVSPHWARATSLPTKRWPAGEIMPPHCCMNWDPV